MKKVLALAVVAFGAVAAQAVTYTWNSQNKNFADGSGNVLYAYSDITSLKISVTYQNTKTNVGTAYRHDYFAITGNASDGNGMLKLSIVGYTNTNNGASQLVVSSSEGTTTVTENVPNFTSDLCGQNKDITTVFTFGGLNADGVFTKVSQQHTFSSGATQSSTVQGTFDFNEKVLNTIETYTGAEVVSATIDIEGTAILPEPGVLGLLALGVAGLALKRKVA